MLPWERAAGSAAVAPPLQQEDLDTRLLGELQHLGVVVQIVIRLDPSDTAWVKFANICASAEVGTCPSCLAKATAFELLSHTAPDHAGGPHHVGQQQQHSDGAMQWPSSLTLGPQDALLCVTCTMSFPIAVPALS